MKYSFVLKNGKESTVENGNSSLDDLRNKIDEKIVQLSDKK